MSDNKFIDDPIKIMSGNKPIEDISNQPDEKKIIGGEVEELEYKLNLTLSIINPDLIKEHPLINRENVIKLTEKYIKTYYSTEFQNYNIDLKKLYLKYNKKHIIENKNNTVYLRKKNSKGKYVLKVRKPVYINIKEKLNELDNKIQITKFNVEKLFDYLKFDNKDPNKLKEFNKNKEEYIKLLEEYESIKLYDIVINNKDITEKTSNIYYHNIVSKPDINAYLEEEQYNIPNELIDIINNNKVQELIKYNNLLSMIKSNDKGLKKHIKDYLMEINNNSFENKINNFKKIQENYIKFIVSYD